MAKTGVCVLLLLCISAVMATHPRNKRGLGDRLGNLEHSAEKMGENAQHLANQLQQGGQDTLGTLKDWGQNVVNKSQDLATNIQQGQDPAKAIGQGFENFGQEFNNEFGGSSAVTASLAAILLPVVTLLLKTAILS